MFDGFSLSVRGHSHVKENIAKQDCAFVHTDPKGWAMAAVSDGHGGDEYFRSHLGSRFAVESALQSVKSCLEEKDEFLKALRGGDASREAIFRRLESSIITGWKACISRFDAAVREYGESPHDGDLPFTVEYDWGSLRILGLDPDAAEAPFIEDGISLEWEKRWIADREVTVKEHRPERLYGCTLLIAVMSPEFIFSLQIGDGSSVAIYPGGKAEMMVPVESGISSNVTDSMCESNPLEKFEHALFYPADDPEAGSSAPPVCISLSTDGLFNSFSNTEDFLRFNSRVLKYMAPAEREAFAKNLEEHLNQRSRQGSSDDISMALVFGADTDYDAISLE